MKKKDLTRREFLYKASAGTVAAVASGAIPTLANIKKKQQHSLFLEVNPL